MYYKKKYLKYKKKYIDLKTQMGGEDDKFGLAIKRIPKIKFVNNIQEDITDLVNQILYSKDYLANSLSNEYKTSLTSNEQSINNFEADESDDEEIEPITLTIEKVEENKETSSFSGALKSLIPRLSKDSTRSDENTPRTSRTSRTSGTSTTLIDWSKKPYEIIKEEIILLNNALINLNPSIGKDGQCYENIANNDKWVSCVDKCQSRLSMLVDYELNTTICILRFLSNSVLTIKDEETFNNNLTISIDYQNIYNLNNNWENDSKYLNIIEIANDNISKGIGGQGRLVLGFGPSSSGKTYWAKAILKILNSTYKYVPLSQFPNSFLSIDGGIYRESSYIYQTIIKIIKELKCFAGLENLVASGFSSKNSIFNSNVPKKTIKIYLKQLSESKNISLYVPETLSGCISPINCYSIYKDYIDITKDNNWIGLFIWQHKESSKCNFKEGFQCTGCTNSGKYREKLEGKKYSSKAWDISYNNGEQEYQKGPGGAYWIHNSGGKKYNDIPGKTIILDMTNYNTAIRGADERIIKNIKEQFDLNTSVYKYAYVNKENIKDYELEPTKTG